MGSFAQISAATRTAAPIDFGFVRADFGWITRTRKSPQINFGFVRRFIAAPPDSVLPPTVFHSNAVGLGSPFPTSLGQRQPVSAREIWVLLITWRSFRTILASFRKKSHPNRVAVPNRRVFCVRSDGRRLRSSCHPTSVKVAGGFVCRVLHSRSTPSPVGSFVDVLCPNDPRLTVTLCMPPRVGAAINREFPSSCIICLFYQLFP